MRSHSHHASRLERAASVAAACGLTLGTALSLVAAVGPRFARQMTTASATDVRRSSERVAYAIVRAPVPTATAPRQVVRSSALRAPHAIIAPQLSGPITPAPDTSPPTPLTPRAEPNEPLAANMNESGTVPARAPAGAPTASASVAFKRPSIPIRFDSALRAMTDSIGIGLSVGAIKPLPLTQAERDAKWRDEAFEVFAARGAGVPYIRKIEAGGIGIPLPFGGRSRKERERDRLIEAELKVVRSLRQKKVDSVVAARARRRADSLANVRSPTQPPLPPG